jgi:CDP-glucose 4,6-dehydratase
MNPRDNFWAGRRVLVTGCTGLLGGWVVASLLERGACVVGLVRDQGGGTGPGDRITLVRGDVADEPLLERVLTEYDIQTVFQLAGQTSERAAERSPLSTFESNIKGTWCVLEAARRSGGAPQVIVTSSDQVYGESGTLPLDEEAPLEAQQPLAASKVCADLLARSYFASFSLPVCVARCGSLFGGGDLNWDRLVPGAIQAVLHNQRPVLRAESQPARDYLYVKDAAAAHLRLAECMALRPDVVGQAFNFPGETPLGGVQIMQRILAALSSSLEPDVRGGAARALSPRRLSGLKARTVLGWATHTLDEAIRETVAWYRAYFACEHRDEKGVVKSTLAA